MKATRSIGDMNGGSSLECYRLVDSFAAEKPGYFQSARTFLYGLGFDETEPDDMPRILPGREPKWQ
jgi:hypothetical protein